jgi:hypothetical protein
MAEKVVVVISDTRLGLEKWTIFNSHAVKWFNFLHFNNSLSILFYLVLYSGRFSSSSMRLEFETFD